LAGILFFRRLEVRGLVEFLVEFRVDGRDLGVGDAVAFTLGVEDRVDVQA